MLRSAISKLGLPLVLVLAFALPASAARTPVPVSPGGGDRSDTIEARCPTFSWAGIPGARGYQLAVFRVSDTAGAQPMLVTRASVSGDARAFTPSIGQCLERGQRYAWSVAVAGEASDWSPPFLFEVEAAPSLEEVEQAIATLQRYREHHLGDEPLSPTVAAADVPEQLGGASSREPLRTRAPRKPFAADSPLPGAVTSSTSGVVRVASAATPSLGSPSLKVSANVALGASSNLFKNDEVFLWDDTGGNTALGRNALASASGSATNNTAVGRDALRSTVSGGSSAHGSFNTAVGDGALRTNTTGNGNTANGYGALFSNTTGYRNTASGHSALLTNTTGNRNTASGDQALLWNTTGDRNTASGNAALIVNTTGDRNTANGSRALQSNTTGHRNTASGAGALYASTTGDRNTAIGYRAGQNATTGHDNVFVGSGAHGTAGETNTIRIGGTSTGGDTPGSGEQNRTFINGIRGITTGLDDAGLVLIDSTGQLGTISSSREVKQDVQDLAPLADRLLDLRPVAFRYKQHAEAGPDTPLQFGLIAEEVAEVFPELVVFDAEGKPETVKYHLLSALLLGELQKQHTALESQREEHRAELQQVLSRLITLESRQRGEPGTERSQGRR